MKVGPAAVDGRRRPAAARAGGHPRQPARRCRSHADEPAGAGAGGPLGRGLGARHFERFSFTPLAAASIGQVHARAPSTGGERLAIKVQYPGVRAEHCQRRGQRGARCCASPACCRASLDFAPLLDEAKRQLHDEADYLKEAAHLQALSRPAGRRTATSRCPRCIAR